MSSSMFPLDNVRIDERCQPRVSLAPNLIDEYADAMSSDVQFPPITVYHDGRDYWLADGFHRVFAARKANKQQLNTEIKPGGVREAILFSVGANATHGQRRSNEDKHRSVDILLEDSEWAMWSDREIARRCGVSHQFVSNQRSSLSTVDSEERVYVDRHGNTAKMNTSKIGKRESAPIDDEDDDAPLSDFPYEVVDPETGEVVSRSLPPQRRKPDPVPDAEFKAEPLFSGSTQKPTPIPTPRTGMHPDDAAMAIMALREIRSTNFHEAGVSLVEIDRNVSELLDLIPEIVSAISSIAMSARNAHQSQHRST
jgi:hypothetical protein